MSTHHSPTDNHPLTTTDHAIYSRWLTDSLATYPDSAIAHGTHLVVDPYDVVNKKEYPPLERLQYGAPDAYDCVMLTGSSRSFSLYLFACA